MLVTREYHRRFSRKKRLALHEEGISPDFANQFDNRFDVDFIDSCFKDGIDPSLLSQYAAFSDKRDVFFFAYYKIPFSVLAGFDDRFSVDDMVILYKNHVHSDVANEYDPRFNAKEVEHLHSFGVYPSAANKYNPRFNTLDIIQLTGHYSSPRGQALDPAIAGRYPPHFNGSDINSLCFHDVSPEQAAPYAVRFHGLDVVHLIAAHISAAEANGFHPRLGVDLIKEVKEGRITEEAVLAYPERYSHWDILKFLQKGISGGVASSYEHFFEDDKSSCFYDVEALVEKCVTPEDLREYKDRFTLEEAVHLIESGVSANQAKRYHAQFTAKAISFFAKWIIPPEETPIYPETFSKEDIEHFVTTVTLPASVKRFSSQPWTAWTISQAVELGISEEQLVAYNLAPKNIRDCINRGYTPEQVAAFNKRFSGTGRHYNICDIIRFLGGGISGEDANAYDPRLYCNRILWLHSKGISGDQTHGFDARFDNKSIGTLLGDGITGEQASSYNWGFHDITVQQLCEAGIPNKVAESYLPRFRWADELIALVEKNVPPEIAKAYEDRFDAKTIATLYDAGYLPEQAAKYSDQFYEGGIVLLAKHKIPPETANLYNPERFSALEVHALIDAGVPHEGIDQYHLHFDGFGISFLWQAHINSHQANEYLEGFEPKEIVKLFSLGVTGETVPVEKQERLKPILSTIATFREGSVRYLDHGGYGVVLRLGEDLVIKVSQDVEAEAKLLEQITTHHAGKQRHIARYKGFQNGVLVIEYIDGPSLEDYILGSDPLPDEEIVKYASHVLEGLIEMRKAGVIHHRDLKPRNIMIERKTKNAILVDVGVASTKRGTGKNRLFPRRGYNKAYGTHDLVALGQVLYFMATGEHIFSHSTSMLLSSGGKYDVRDEREKVYQNPSDLLHPYFKKIEETVRNPLVQGLIKDCLTARVYDFRKMQRKFAYALEHII